MGKVLHLPRRKAESGPGPMPDSFVNAELLRLFSLAHKWGFNLEQVYYGTNMVRGWYLGDPSHRQREDWVMVIRNALCAGWALRGFKEWLPRRGSSILRQVQTPRDASGCRPLTQATIAQVIEVMNARSLAKTETARREREEDC